MSTTQFTERTAPPEPPAVRRPLSVAMVGLRGIPTTYGGVERAVEELSAELVKRGHRVTVYARTAYTDPSITSHRGVDLIRLPQINTKHLEAISHTTLALADVLRRREYDIVHVHATGPALLSFLPRLGRIPTVATIQGLDYRREKWGPVAKAVLRVAARAAVTFPQRTIVVSRELERHCRDVYGRETLYIPNGVRVDPPPEMESLEGLERDRFVLFLGRLVPEKHVHTLITAYRSVDTDLPLVIAGPDSHSGDYVEKLRSLAAQDPRVRLIGPRYGDDKSWLLHNASVFVQPSSIEGLPIALLEALACGRYPIVSGIPENLEPVTLPSGVRLGGTVRVDDPDDLGRAIARALTYDRRAEDGETLRRHVLDTYAWEQIAAATEAVYLGLLR